jgi:hypothetical protein
MLTLEEQQAYAERNAIIQQLGFSSYKVYLQSELWKSIRRQILLPHTRCRSCGKKATTLHHSRYKLEDMNGKCLTYLLPVCQGCHHKAEFNKKGEKIGVERATNKLNTWKAEHNKKESSRAGWAYFFKTVEEIRIYIGADPTEEARRLTAKLDEALSALPPKKVRQKKHKKGRVA